MSNTSKSGKPTAMANSAKSWATGMEICTILLGVVTVILLIVLVTRGVVTETAIPLSGPNFNAASARTAVLLGSTPCDDGNSCTQDFKYVIEGKTVCQHYDLPTNTSCNQQCLLAGSGQCVTGKCRGLCNGYCPFYMDFELLTCPPLTLEPDIQEAVENEDVFYAPLCFYGKCIFILESPISPAMTCALAESLEVGLDYIQDTPQCLAFLDSSDLVSSCIKASTLCVDGYPVCIYQYQCSGYDIFAPTAPTVFGKSSLRLQSHASEEIADTEADETAEESVVVKPVKVGKEKEQKKNHTKVSPPPTVKAATKKPSIVRGSAKKVRVSNTAPAHLNNKETSQIRQAYLDAVAARNLKPKAALGGLGMKRTTFDPVALGDLSVVDAKILVYSSLGGGNLAEFIGLAITTAREARNSTV